MVFVDILVAAKLCRNQALDYNEQEMPGQSEEGTLVFYVNGMKVIKFVLLLAIICVCVYVYFIVCILLCVLYCCFGVINNNNN